MTCGEKKNPSDVSGVGRDGKKTGGRMEIAKWERGFETLFKADAQQVATEILSIGESATPQQEVVP